MDASHNLPSIITEDWYTGYLADEDLLVPDVSGIELEDEERDDYPHVTLDEKRLDDDLLAWLHRDQDDDAILRRWNRPSDELDAIEAIEDADERSLWRERMLAFHEASLHKRLTAYFGTSDYRTRDIVLSWKQQNGRWVPDEKMNVLAWIARKIEEKGDRLSGIASCNATIRAKIARKRASREGSAMWWKVYDES